MKKSKFIAGLALMLSLTAACTFAACGGDDKPDNSGEQPGVQTPADEYGTISGTVMAYGQALSGVKVAIGSNDTVTSATGAFTLENVKIENSVTITFSKNGYADKTVTVAKDDWQDKAVTLETITMNLAEEEGTVSGVVRAGGIVLAGASVKLGDKEAVITDSEGKYSVSGISMSEAEELDITVTHPACDKYEGKVTVTAGATAITKDVTLTAKVVPVLNKTYLELAAMSASSTTDFKHVKDTEMWKVEHGPDGHRVITDHGEGICLHVDNNATDADMVPAIYEKLSITAQNTKMMFRARGFLGENDKVGLLSVRVVDLADYTVEELKQNSADDSAWYEMNSNGYVQYNYDLSAYKGKDVVVIIGAKQGNHNAIERIRFIGENENWVMPFTTAADLSGLTVSTAADVILPTNNQDGVRAIMNDGTWNKVGDQEASNEGWLLKDADYAEEGSTQIRVFTYKKMTFTNMGTVIVRARTFSGQNSVSSGHSGQIYPEIILRLIDSEGNLVNVTSTYNRADNGEGCQDFYFKLNEEISGDYTFVIGMARGQRLALESIKFGGAMTSVNVTGTVKIAGVPAEGATVKYGYNRGSVTTAADGTFTLPVDIVAGGNVEVTISKEGFADINRTVSGTSDASLGDISLIKTILPNLTTEDIEGMSALTDSSFGTDAIKEKWRQYGDVDKHGEGTCLQANANSPAYVCAKIAIDESKQYMKFNARMFVRDSDQRGLLQVKVIKADGTVDTLTPVRVYHGNEVLTGKVLPDGTLINSEDYYTEGVYDLTEYVGTTVVIAIIAVNDVEEVTKSIHNAINDIAFRSNGDTEFGKPAVSQD